MEVSNLKNSIVMELGLDKIKRETADKLLDVLYVMEDEQCYKVKKVSQAINYLQNNMQNEKPIIHFNSTGESGNIYVILTMVKQTLNDVEFNKLWQKVKQGTYADALEIIREKVDDGNY